MSIAIDEEEQIIKDVPVIDKAELDPDINKKKKILYYALMFGTLSIIIAIVVILILTKGKTSDTQKSKSNILKANYYTSEDETEVKLFTYHYITLLSSLKIDDKTIFR